MLLGDIHNSRPVLDAALRTAADNNCDVLIQVGDFWLQDTNWRGYHPNLCDAHAQRGSRPNACCRRRRQPRSVAVADRVSGPRRHPGGSRRWPAAASGGIAVVGRPRQRLELWSQRRFGALGGSVSPNKWQPGVATWIWPQEVITQARRRPAQTQRLRRARRILISHDAPADTTGLISGMWMPPSVHDEALAAQLLVQDAVDATGPGSGVPRPLAPTKTAADSPTAAKSSASPPTAPHIVPRSSPSPTSKPPTSTRCSANMATDPPTPDGAPTTSGSSRSQGPVTLSPFSHLQLSRVSGAAERVVGRVAHCEHG